MKTILMTGVTGFLGSFMASKIIENSEDKILFLTDSSSAESRVLKSIANIFKTYGKESQDIRNFEVLLCEDLNNDNSLKNCLSTIEVDEVWHIAAHMSYDFNELPNSIAFNAVTSAKIMTYLKYCGRYYFMSTTGVAGLGSHIKKEVPEELLSDFESVNPYTASKVLAEYVLWNQSVLNGIPLTIIRPGSIIGDSINGWVNNTKYGYYSYLHIIKKFINKEIDFYLDIDPNKKFPVIHINHLVDLCLVLRNRNKSDRKEQEIFHACNSNLFTAREHFEILESLSLGKLRIKYGVGETGFNKVFNNMNADNNSFLGVKLSYSNEKLIESIGRENIPPSLTKESLANIFTHYIRNGEAYVIS